jgi:hypothetical protein
MNMKSTALALCIACLVAPAFSEVRFDVAAIIGNEFIDSPSIDQAAQGLGTDPAGGLDWEVVIGHSGLGSAYLARFRQEAASSWWLDWNSQVLYGSYHFLGARRFFDPFVDVGLGCAGRVFLGSGEISSEALALSLYPFVSAGASFDVDGLRLGAKLSYALSEWAIPATSIPTCGLGRFQAYAYVGFSVGGRRHR